MGGFLMLAAFVWFVVGLFIPRKVAPFFTTKPRLKILGTSFVIVCVGLWLSAGPQDAKPKETGTTTKVEAKKED